VVHVGRRWPGNLDIGIVSVTFGMTWFSGGSRGQIYPPDKRDLGRLSRVDQPTLLVMQVVSMRAVPTNPEG
jgi:hypothetical protein